MCNEYEDYYEEVLEYEFVESLNKQILDYVNENLKVKLKDYESTKQENKEMINTFRRLKSEKQQAIAKLEEAERRDINNILEGYNVRDKAWRVKSEWNRIDCEKCNGKKLISVTYENNIIEIKCVECNGNGYKNLITYKPHDFTIRNINILTSEKGKFEVSLRDYNSDSYKLKDVFKTIEECQAEIDSNEKYQPKYHTY